MSVYLDSLKSSVTDYAKEITSSKAKWLDFTKDVAKVTGSRKLLDYTTGFRNVESLIMRTPTWTIGGAAFEGIIKTDHSQEVQPTHYPVQNGAIMTDHAIVLPAELDIQIMVSDSYSKLSWKDIKTGQKFVDTVLKNYDLIQKVKNIESITTLFAPKGQVAQSGERGVAAYALLKAMEIARIPIEVVTRLQTYKSMLITNVSAPDDVNTLYGLSVNIHLTEVHVAQVGQVVESARAHVTQSTQSGAQPVTEVSEANNKTLLKAGVDAIKGALS